jgi:hypothetical protein
MAKVFGERRRGATVCAPRRGATYYESFTPEVNFESGDERRKARDSEARGCLKTKTLAYSFSPPVPSL